MKVCLCDGCTLDVWSHKYCKKHQYLRTDEKWLKTKQKQSEKAKQPRKAIAKASPKYAKELAKYSRENPGWKKENSICAVPGCGQATTDSHHAAGRGALLNDRRFILPLCKPHHDLCKDMPEVAEEAGLILTRIQRDYLLDGGKNWVIAHVSQLDKLIKDWREMQKANIR